MAEEETLIVEALPVRRGQALRTAGKWLAIGFATLLILAAALIALINSDPGRRIVADFINDMEMASGLRIKVDRLEGSLYGELTIRGLTLSDPKGEFFSAPVVELDWRPFRYFRNHVDIRSASIPRARLRRLPELRPSGDPDAPLLPDIDVDIGRLELARLQIDPAVTGQRHLLALQGSAHIADRRARLSADARTLSGPGLAGGDRLVLRLDAVPDDDRLAIAMRLDAPAGGFVAGLTGIDRPLMVGVGGRGTWQQWLGRASASLGGTQLAALSLSARNGTFTANGPVRAGIWFKGPVERLAAPFVQLNLVTTLENRRADTRLQLRSRALAVAADGLIDLGRNEFGSLRLAARLLEPGAIAPDLRARDLRIALLLNGPFSSPRVAYDLQARAIGFEETIVEGLRARGSARVDPERITIPVSAQAARITGLNPALGGLVTNVRIDGSFAISGPHVLSDNLRIRSDRMNATAIVVANIARGEYRGAIKGTIDNYLVEGVGLIDLTTDMELVSRPQGFGLDGRVVIRTRRLDNATARDLMGGNGIISARLSMDPEGVFTISDLRVRSPGLSITSGGGRYGPGDRIQLRAAGTSAAYGPLAIEVGGTVRSPNIRLRAARPGFGIGLADVVADVRSTERGFAVTARGQSQYGPFTADLTILTGRGPLTIEVGELTIAGLSFRGRIVQTEAGPFSGTLTVSGSGIDGVVRLSTADGYQRADIDARANGARIPGEVPILVQRGTVRASAILYPNAPSITGDVQFAGVRSGDLRVETARARIDYRGGRGRVQLVADGSRGVPFRLAASAAIAPERIRIAAQGRINRTDFRLVDPADLRKEAAGWRLAPTTIDFPQGNLRVAARFGQGLVLESRIDDMDLSIVNMFAPGSGLGGRLSGSLDFSQPRDGSFPRAEARLTINDFTRTGAAVRSSPVDIRSVARLGPDGGVMSAVIRRSGAAIGRSRITLQPLSPAAGSWTERLLASPLGGGIRYNGPAAVLWSLSGIADHQLAGPVGVAADFSGRVEQPQLAGVIRANNLTYGNEAYGTQVTNIALQGRFTSSQLVISQLSGRAGQGTVTGEGSIDLASARGYPIDLHLTFDRARLARSDALGATVSGNVDITNRPGRGALISGDLRLPEVRYQVIRQGAAELAELEGVRRKGEPLPSPGGESAAGAPSIWNLDLRVRADNEVYISGMGLESEWSTDLRVRGTSASPVITGRAQVIRGTYSFGGRRFELTEGQINFTGSRPPDPSINIVASTDVDDITATIRVTGSSSDPNIALTSSPALPQDEILARLFFGNSVTELSATQAIQLAASLNSLTGSGGGLNPLGKLRSAGGFDRLRILGADERTGRGTAVAAGMHISNDIYVEVITDARGFTATQLEIALSKSLSVLSQVGSFGSSSFSVRYRKDY